MAVHSGISTQLLAPSPIITGCVAWWNHVPELYTGIENWDDVDRYFTDCLHSLDVHTKSHCVVTSQFECTYSHHLIF